MRVLVLGSTNLIGNHVLRAAVKAGWETAAYLRPSRRKGLPAALEGIETEIILGELTNEEALRKAMLGRDLVFHAAGYTPPNRFRPLQRLTEARQHIEQILRVVRQAEIGKLVYTSSVSTIGRSDIPSRLPDEWDKYRLGAVEHPYWDAKLAQEEAVLALGQRDQVPVVVVNPSFIIGPYDFAMESAGPLLEMAQHGAAEFYPGRVSIADARDIAQGHIAAATQGRLGERTILAGHNITYQEMSALMARACKVRAPERLVDFERLERLSKFSERVATLGRPNRSFPLGFKLAAVRWLGWYDSAKARQELEYSNRPLLDTFRATLTWLQRIGKLPLVDQ